MSSSQSGPRLLPGLVWCLIPAFWCNSPAHAGLFDSNLLGNPGFEDYYTGSGPDWQDGLVVQYNVQTANGTSRGVQPWTNVGSYVCAIRSDGPGSANGGDFFGMGGRFAAGAGSISTLRQDVDLAACGFQAVDLDSQTLVLSAGAYLSSWPSDGDTVAVRVEYLNTTGQSLGVAYDTGPQNVDTWTRYASPLVPVVPGTRFIRFDATFTKAAGTNNDGRIDDAWVVLFPASPPASPMSDRNLVCNPGFEQSTRGWTCPLGNPRTRLAGLDDVPVHGGQYALFGGQTGINGAARQSIAFQEFDPARYGFSDELLNDPQQIWFVKLSAWIYGLGEVGQAKLRLEMYDRYGTLLDAYDSGRVRANKSPRLFNFQIVLPPKTKQMVLIYDTLDTAGTNIDGYLDDVSLILSRVPYHPARIKALTAAHRGNSIVAPENTLSALRASIGAAHLAEFDVYPCQTGELVVMHDSTVGRTTDGTGNITSLSLAQLSVLDAGSWFSPDFTGEKVPTMAEAISTLLPHVTPLIERKGGSAAAYVSELQQLGVQQQVVIQSFDWNFLAQVHALDPTIRLGALGSGTLGASQIQQVRNAGASFIAWASGGVNATTLDMVHNADLDLFVWTVNNLTDVQYFISLGVDGIITDHPAAVSWITNPHWCRADFDVDGDVDPQDLLQFELCRTGPGVPWHDAWCGPTDIDVDWDVDQTDFGYFQRCFSDVDSVADPDCAAKPSRYGP